MERFRTPQACIRARRTEETVAMLEEIAGTAMDQQTLGTDQPTYSYKPSLLGAPWEFSLTPAGLVWNVGRHSGRVPYQDVRMVRLLFRPTTMQTHRFVTEIWSQDGPKLTIASTSYRSMIEHERQDAAYRNFVTALHRRIGAAGNDTRLVSGKPGFLYWPGLVVFAVVALALGALTVQGLRTQFWWGAAFVAGFLALFLWQIGGYFRRNRPGTYRADGLPRELLPRG